MTTAVMLSVARHVYHALPVPAAARKPIRAAATFYDKVRQNDPHFERDLKESMIHVEKVAKMFNDRGIRTTTPDTKIRPTEEQMRDFTDNGDLWVHPPCGGSPLKIECKQRKFNFDSVESFPYPDVMVSNCHTHDRANPKPAFYVITDHDVQCVLVVPVSTFEQWTRRDNVWDRFKKRYRNFYNAPKSVFISLDQACADIAART